MLWELELAFSKKLKGKKKKKANWKEEGKKKKPSGKTSPVVGSH